MSSSKVSVRWRRQDGTIEYCNVHNASVQPYIRGSGWQDQTELLSGRELVALGTAVSAACTTLAWASPPWPGPPSV